MLWGSPVFSFILWWSRVCFPLLQDTDSSSAIKEMQRGLDDNNDGKVSFQEYLNLIGYVANALSERKATQQKVEWCRCVVGAQKVPIGSHFICFLEISSAFFHF